MDWDQFYNGALYGASLGFLGQSPAHKRIRGSKYSDALRRALLERRNAEQRQPHQDSFGDSFLDSATLGFWPRR